MTERVLLRGGPVVTPHAVRDATAVLIEDGRIAAIGAALPDA